MFPNLQRSPQLFALFILFLKAYSVIWKILLNRDRFITRFYLEK